MLDYRSPSFLLVPAVAFSVLCIASWLLSGMTYFTLACSLLAAPPVIEWEMCRRSASLVAMFYGRNVEEIERQAYRPLSSLLRCCFLLVFFALAAIVGRGGLSLIPDSKWVVPVILGPVAVYVIWVVGACWRNVASMARHEGWERRRPAKFGR